RAARGRARLLRQGAGEELCPPRGRLRRSDRDRPGRRGEERGAGFRRERGQVSGPVEVRDRRDPHLEVPAVLPWHGDEGELPVQLQALINLAPRASHLRGETNA